ncbi:hypothetical protein V8E54_007706 [Elaphomyces granulatus]
MSQFQQQSELDDVPLVLRDRGWNMNNSLRAPTTFGRAPYLPPQRRLQSLGTERVSFPRSTSINPGGGRMVGSHEEHFANVPRIAGPSASMIAELNRIPGRATTVPSSAARDHASTSGAVALASNRRPPSHLPINASPQPSIKREVVTASTGGDSDNFRSFSNLESLNSALLTDRQALFYLGVLAVQTLLLPRFRFSGGIGGAWGVELTLYGHTISKPESFGTQIGAKVQVCREALELLKGRYPNWIVPDEPNDCITPSHWPWEKLLDDYCLQNGVQRPVKYVKHVHGRGYLYEVEIPGIAPLTARTYYSREADALDASAHISLYSLLVQGTGDPRDLAGPSQLRQVDGSMLAQVPRAPSRYPATPSSKPPILQGTNDGYIPSKPRRVGGSMLAQVPRAPSAYFTPRSSNPALHHRLDPSKIKKKRKKKQPVAQVQNSNLIPLTTRKLDDIDVPEEPADRKWMISADELKAQMRGLQVHQDRLKSNVLPVVYIRSVLLMGLHILTYFFCRLSPTGEGGQPRLEIHRRESSSGTASYNVAALFPHDPFLARAGRIGEVCGVPEERAAVKRCSAKVVNYLIALVEEEEEIAQQVAEERARITSWSARALSAEIRRGLSQIT